MFEGVQVTHGSYGEGVVISIDSCHIRVKFPTCEKSFLFPEAMGKYLNTDDLGLINYLKTLNACHDKVYRMVWIQFYFGSRVYGYLCDDMTIKVGDTVVVNGRNGETIVTVVKVSDVYESELPFRLERLKKILRKEQKEKQSFLRHIQDF